jgi:large repetitive protein
MKKMNGKLLLLLFCVLILFPFVSKGQSDDLNWVIGNRIIEFHKTTKEPSASGAGVTSLTGPGAVAEDPVTGNILFYTDGVKVYDATNQVMVNPGGDLNADVNANQPVVIGPVPGTPNQYYIFTHTATGAIEASIVDMSLQGNAAPVPLGEVISSNVPIPALVNQSDGMIVIPRDGSTTEYWIITHTAGTTTYNVTLVSAGGFTINSFSLVGSIQDVANFTFNPVTNQLAVSPGEPNRNVELLSFDPGSGSLAFDAALPLSFTTAAQGIYDVEWSPNGDYVYISGFNNSGQPDLLQYDLLNISQPPPPTLFTPQSVLPAGVTASLGLQVGPDSVIYHLYQQGGVIRMGMITNPDTTVAVGVGYDPAAFTGNFTEAQFSSSLPAAIPVTIDFTFDPPCLNVPVKFFPTVSQAVDSLVWTVNGQRMSGQWSPLQTFDQPGDYTITVSGYVNGEIVATSPPKVVSVAQSQVQVTLDPEITGCYSEFKEPINPPAGFIPCGDPGGDQCLSVTAQVTGSTQMQWFGPDGPIAGATSATFSPSKPGFYWIVVTSGACNYYAGINVKQYDTQNPQAFNWYFGNQAGVDFNPIVEVPPGNPIDISSSSAMNAPEGTATISDRNGNVIFYTDGQSVWVKDNPTPIETNLGGSPGATQSSVIVPVPGDETLYYIFTTQEVGEGTFELRYAIFDRKLDPVNGLGDIVDPTPADATDSPSTVLFTNATEQVLAVDNWIIVHEYGNNTFRAYQVTAEGVGEPVYSNVGLDHSILDPNSAEGYMSYGAGRIAIANGNTIEYFDFDSATGEITNGKSVPSPGGQVYGLAFSASGEKMYATILGLTGSIVEYEFDSTSMAYVQTNLIATNLAGQPGAIVRGINGLQVAIEGHNNLGLINEQPTGTPSTFTPSSLPFNFAAGAVTLGLPNFIQMTNDPILEPGLTITNACEGGDVVFTATGKDPTIDQFDWFFSDGTEMLDAGPEVTKNYPTAGTYSVKVIVYNRCKPKLDVSDPNYPGPGEAEIDMSFEVNPPPLTPALGNGVICGTTGVKLKGFNGSDPDFLAGRLTYLWSNGTTDSTLTVTTAGNYSVVVTNSVTGCSNTASKFVNQYFSTLELGPPLNICEGGSTTFVAGFDTRAQYTWTVDGAVQVTTPINEFQFATGPTTFPARATPYVVQVVMNDVVCSVTDQVEVTVNELPAIALQGVPIDDDCDPAINSGQFDVIITGPVGSSVSYEATSSAGGVIGLGNNVIAPHDPAPFAGLPADTYTVLVADDLTSCPATFVQVIDTDNLDLNNAVQVGTCYPNVQIQVDVIGGAPDFSWQVINETTGQPVISSSTTQTGPTILSDNLGSVADGPYRIRVTDSNNCVASEPINIATNPAFQVSIDLTNICAAANQVQAILNPADPTASYSWTATNPQGQNGLAAPSTGPTASLVPGTWDVTVNVDGDETIACPGTVSRTVPVSPIVTVDIEAPDNLCTDPVELAAIASAPVISFQWERQNGTSDPSWSTDRILITSAENGNTLTVTVNAPNGCEFSNSYGPVDIVPPFTVSITPLSSMPCEDASFDLTATSTNGNASFTWELNGLAIAETGSPISVDRAGSYVAIGTVLSGTSSCSYRSDPYSVTVVPKPAVELGPLRRICPYPAAPDDQEQARLDPGPQYAGYEWFIVGEGGVEQPLNNTAQMHDAILPGIYRVRVTDSNNCANTDDVEVIEECDPIISGPNAFRPGSSIGSNRAFNLFTFFIESEDFQILIFNRWGELVYESSDLDFAWNGGYKGNKGQILPAGTYAYVVRYRSRYFPDKGIQEKRGGVVLLQ